MFYMNEYAIGRSLGAAVGILIGIVLVVIIFKIANKNHKVKSEYDERQEIARGKGFRLAFYTIVIYAAINVVLGMAELSLPMDPAVMAFSYIIVGALVDVEYCIWNDCYWGMNNNKVRYTIAFMIIGLINLIVPIGAAINGGLILDGVLSTPGINLLCSVLLITMGITMGLKEFVDSRRVSSEDSCEEDE